MPPSSVSEKQNKKNAYVKKTLGFIIMQQGDSISLNVYILNRFSKWMSTRNLAPTTFLVCRCLTSSFKIYANLKCKRHVTNLMLRFLIAKDIIIIKTAILKPSAKWGEHILCCSSYSGVENCFLLQNNLRLCFITRFFFRLHSILYRYVWL